MFFKKKTEQKKDSYTLGHYYDDSSDWQHQKWEELVCLLENHYNLKEFSTILDLGCGSGKRTKLVTSIAANNAQAIGVDNNEDMIATARERSTIAGINYKLMSAEDTASLDIPPVDLVQANYSLHWVKNKEKMMEGLNQKSEKGCVFIIGTCERLPQLFVDIDELMAAAGNYKIEKPYYYLTAEEWTAFLEAAGWEIIEIKKNYEEHITGDPHGFLRHWISASTEKTLRGGKLDSLNYDQENAILEEMCKKYRVSGEEALSFYEDTLLIIAEKK